MEMSTLVHIGNATILKSLHLGIAIAQCYTLNFEYVPRNPISPTNTKVTFVNQSVAKLAWQLPEITGVQTNVYYMT